MFVLSLSTQWTEGSVTLAAAHITSQTLSYCILGHMQLYVFRENAQGAKLILNSDWYATDVKKSAQAWVVDDRTITQAFAERVFSASTFGVVRDLEKNDTVVLLSGGVTATLGEGRITTIVGNAYKHGLSAPEVGKEIVRDAVASVLDDFVLNQEQCDATAMVSYVGDVWW